MLNISGISTNVNSISHNIKLIQITVVHSNILMLMCRVDFLLTEAMS